MAENTGSIGSAGCSKIAMGRARASWWTPVLGTSSLSVPAHNWWTTRRWWPYTLHQCSTEGLGDRVFGPSVHRAIWNSSTLFASHGTHSSPRRIEILQKQGFDRLDVSDLRLPMIDPRDPMPDGSVVR